MRRSAVFMRAACLLAALSVSRPAKADPTTDWLQIGDTGIDVRYHNLTSPHMGQYQFRNRYDETVAFEYDVRYISHGEEHTFHDHTGIRANAKDVMWPVNGDRVTGVSVSNIHFPNRRPLSRSNHSSGEGRHQPNRR